MIKNWVDYLTGFSLLYLLVVFVLSYAVFTINRDDDLDDLDFNKSIGG